VQLCVAPQIVSFLSKTSHSSAAASLNKKSQQVCTMLEKQMIFAWAVNPNDTEKLFLKLQVCASVCQYVFILCVISTCFHRCSALTRLVWSLADKKPAPSVSNGCYLGTQPVCVSLYLFSLAIPFGVINDDDVYLYLLNHYCPTTNTFLLLWSVGLKRMVN